MHIVKKIYVVCKQERIQGGKLFHTSTTMLTFYLPVVEFLTARLTSHLAFLVDREKASQNDIPRYSCSYYNNFLP